MYIVLKRNKLSTIMSKAIKKAGNIRSLEKKVRISKSTLSLYKTKKKIISKINLTKLINYNMEKIDGKDIKEKLKDNWAQIKGGQNCVRLKKERGTFEKNMKKCKESSSKYMKKWHEKMKEENPKEYYLTQYTKFKKIGGYKYITKNKEKVRNKLEKDTADMLHKLKIEYEYEPLIKANNRYFFPDFLIDKKIIIECTAWRGHEKATKLKEKINHLKKKFKVYVLIPKHLNRYYKILNKHLIFKLDEMSL